MPPSKPSRPIGDRLENRRHVIGRGKRVRIAEPDQRAMLRALDQAQLRLEHDRAGAFGAHQRARDVEAVLGQQLVEVVAGDPPRNLGKAGRGSARRYRSRIARSAA